LMKRGVEGRTAIYDAVPTHQENLRVHRSNNRASWMRTGNRGRSNRLEDAVIKLRSSAAQTHRVPFAVKRGVINRVGISCRHIVKTIRVAHELYIEDRATTERSSTGLPDRILKSAVVAERVDGKAGKIRSGSWRND